MEELIMIRKAIIPVAGKGTRFLPMTNGISKEMLPLVDLPVLYYILKECADSGITEIMLITKDHKKDINKFFSIDKEEYVLLEEPGKAKLRDDVATLLNKVKISYLNQRDDLSGTAGAIYVAKQWANNEPFAVLFGDDVNYTEEGKRPAIGQLCDVFEKTNKMVLGCQWVEASETDKYGMVSLVKRLNDESYSISGVVEKPKRGTEPSLLASLARYIMPANTFEYIEEQINDPSSTGKEVCLTDTIDMIIKAEGNQIACIMDSIRYDTGDKLGYFKAFVDYTLRHKKYGEDFKNFIKETAEKL